MTDYDAGDPDDSVWYGLAFIAVVFVVCAGGWWIISHSVSEPSPMPTAIITIVDRAWDGDSNHFGYVTTSNGDVYRVQNPEDYMRMQLNHTYNVDIDFITWKFPVITKTNYEVMP